MKASTPEPPLTHEQLLYTYKFLRRPSWPDTLEGALADPACRPLLQGQARQFLREGRPMVPSYRPPTPAGAPPVPPTQLAPPARMQFRRGPRFDPRRAAANDFDD